MKTPIITGEFIGSFEDFKKKHKEAVIWMQEDERDIWLKEQYNKVHLPEKEKKVKKAGE